MIEHIETLPGRLAREIARVTELRAEYAQLLNMPQVNVRPALAMMDKSLEQAKVAAAVADIECQIRAVRDLQGYSS